MKTLTEEINKSPEKYRSGYAFACDSRLVGVFRSYDEALSKSKDACRDHGLIVKLPYKEEVEEIELGFPW